MSMLTQQNPPPAIWKPEYTCHSAAATHLYAEPIKSHVLFTLKTQNTSFGDITPQLFKTKVHRTRSGVSHYSKVMRPTCKLTLCTCALGDMEGLLSSGISLVVLISSASGTCLLGSAGRAGAGLTLSISS